jgi:N6-adenosine-specific RNA methylase IME4
MTLDSINALPVAALAAQEAVLWLWTTNTHLPVAFNVVASWGFRYVTTLTWAKNRPGLGDWLRGQTEHCLLAVKGRPVVTLTTQGTVIHAPVEQHSGEICSQNPVSRQKLF